MRLSRAALAAQNLINRLKSEAPDSVIAQVAIAGALGKDTTQTEIDAAAKRLDMIADEGEDGWSGQFDSDDALVMQRIIKRPVTRQCRRLLPP